MSWPPGSGRMGTGRPEDQGPNLAWSALFVVASVVGGLAAADVAHESAIIAVLFSLLVAAIMVILLYQGMLDGDPDPGRPSVPAAPGAGPAPGQARDMPAGHRVAGGQHRYDSSRDDFRDGMRPVAEPPTEPVRQGVVRVVQSQPGGNSGGGWWEGHATARPSGRGASPAAPRKVDLTQFLDQALIAQCPRCGSFRVDVDNRASEWLFRCQECGQGWPWEPGTPWPAIQVRPEVRGRPNRPRG